MESVSTVCAIKWINGSELMISEVLVSAKSKMYHKISIF